MKQPLPHQIEDAQFMASRAVAGNFSGMGSGKTITAIEAVRIVKSKLTIIVCPPIAMAMWKATVEEQLTISAQIVKAGSTALDASTVKIVSYEIATKRVAELSALRPDVLIMDEAHAVKSVDAKRTKALIGHKGLASACKYTWFLTGTPVTRYNDDLYPFLCRVDLQRMGTTLGGTSIDKYRLRYCVTQRKAFPGMRRPKDVVVGNRNTDELNEWLFKGGLAVRRELADVWAAMPPLTINRLPVALAMTDELREMLKAMDKQTQRETEQMISRNDEALATMRRKLGEAKIVSAAKEIAQRVEDGGGPILVGAWHTGVINGLVEALVYAGLRVRIIDGSVSAANRDEAQRLFNAKEIDVLVGQIGAMGVAINLQHGGNRIVVVEEDWSPAVMDQFYARLFRIGQTKHVHVDILVSDTKLDAAVARIAAVKARDQARVMAQGDAA